MISRYSKPEMIALWSPEAKYRRWRDIELAALEGMVEAGLAPQQSLRACEEKAGDFTAEDVAKIEEIEKETRHDVIAFLTFMERRIGPHARWLHMGMTSSDVLDTALGITLRDAGGLLLADIDRVLLVIKERALEHKTTPMIGRSHGIHAEPITFGLKLAVWYDELRRHWIRLARATHGVAVGKISGAVGTFAHLPPAVEAHVCRKLLLVPEPASNQIVQRDRHAEYFTALALCGSSLEKYAVEIRHLQRTEVREVEEPFEEGQKGSSAMPHKRNPILSENITGLARVLRGYAVSAMEDVALWHERDISHSSVERVIGPDATTLLDFMLDRFGKLMADLRIYPERMEENLKLTGGVWSSGSVLLEMTRRGIDRQAAYVIVQRNAMRFHEEGVDFKAALLQDRELRSRMSKQDVEACFSLDHHLRHVDEVFKRVFGE